MDGKNLSYDCIDLPFPLVRRLQVYDHFLWSEPGDNLDEIDRRFALAEELYGYFGIFDMVKCEVN